jgi:hypothetical protein
MQLKWLKMVLKSSFFLGKIEFKMVSVNVALQRFGFTNDYKFISWGHIQYNGPGIFDQTRIG